MALHLSTANSEVSFSKEDIGLASYIEGPVLVAGTTSYQVSLESLLVGHEDWVYSVKWQPPLPSSGNETEGQQPMSILSASMDKTMMIWRPEKTTGIWVNMVTVGELSHTALGFYGGHWAPDGNLILAHGYGGSFHLWRNSGMDYENWQPRKVPSGHYASVSDIAWAKSGEYLLSVSHDQVIISFMLSISYDFLFFIAQNMGYLVIVSFFPSDCKHMQYQFCVGALSLSDLNFV